MLLTHSQHFLLVAQVHITMEDMLGEDLQVLNVFCGFSHTISVPFHLPHFLSFSDFLVKRKQ